MSRGGHPPIPISLGEGEKEKLRSGAHSRTLGHGMVQRAQIVLACAEGESQVMIAKRLEPCHGWQMAPSLPGPGRCRTAR